MLRIRHVFISLCLSLLSMAAMAAPLLRQDLPSVLRDWLPWAMHGHEQQLCPLPYNSDAERVCVWPSHLWVNASATGGHFRFEVRVLGAASAVTLPGHTSLWPQDVRINGLAHPVAEHEGTPVVWLAPGSYVVEGLWPWSAMPAQLQLPKGMATLQVQIDGVLVARQPDSAGRIWLKQEISAITSNDEVIVQTARLLDDQVPLVMTTQYELAVSGKPRDIELPAALWQGWVAESIDSPLPVRLLEDGKLVVQVRAGQWTVSLRARAMTPYTTLTLPTNAISSQEYWAFQAHNDIRLVTVQGVMAVDPKQVPVPAAWQSLPTYRVQPGDVFTLVQTRRGNPMPNPDSLQLRRDLWLDFDGQGWSVRDHIQGQLTRSSRLSMGAAYTLGRVAVDGQDQPITRMSFNAGKALVEHGIEVRQGQVQMVAESRILGHKRELPTVGWQADFQQMAATLHLPPGWRLLHAWGVDHAQGSWLAQWTLWDFFFVLLSALAAFRLLGWRRGVCLGLALVLTWHMPGAPQFLWLAFLGLHALGHVLTQGRLLVLTTWAQRFVVVVMGLLILPYAVEQARLSMYPALERPWQTQGASTKEAAPQAVAADALVETSPVVPAPEVSVRQRKSADFSAYTAGMNAASAYELDPAARVQTGPGVPAWAWQTHALTWMGPVQAAQSMRLLLLPPWGTALFRLVGLLLLVAAWWWVTRPKDQWTNASAHRKPTAEANPYGDSHADEPAPTTILDMDGQSLMGLLLVGCLCLALPVDARAQPTSVSVPAPAPSAVAGLLPDATWLDAMRAKLTAAPACLPACADVSRMQITASGAQIQLLMDVHALAETSLPLPGQGSRWQPHSVSVNGVPATVRRDDGGVLWIMLPAGVHRVTLAADVGDAANVDITLPMPVRRVQTTSAEWQFSGVAPDGQATAAISLARRVAATPDASSGTQRDVLPPFVRIERTIRLGMQWQIETQVQRLSPSLAPVQVRVQLLEGESVNDPAVQVAQGVATLSLGGDTQAHFVSTLKPLPRFEWVSQNLPSQIEVWRVDASPQWHVTHTGIAPVAHQTDGRWLPTWQPWPGEKVVVNVIQPMGMEGQTFTIDSSHTEITPGLRATDVTMRVALRASQGGNHRFDVPGQVNVLSVSMDGQVLPIQPQGAVLMVPVTPGAHALAVQWREARGMSAWFSNQQVNLHAKGVNDSLHINVPADRVVLAVGGPLVGPAVLFWGVLAVIVGMAVALGRWQVAPLRVFSWGLLGLGVAQMSLWGMALVVGWFLAMAGRQRMAHPLRRQWEMARQVGLALLSFVAAAVLLETVRVGLLGYPNLLVLGNGSDANHLHWYADRFDQTMARAWVVSVPVYAYRVAMLLWALWLAASMLGWLKWAWACFSAGGYWPEPVNSVTDVTAKVRK